jgi:hypothetical protein
MSEMLIPANTIEMTILSTVMIIDGTQVRDLAENIKAKRDVFTNFMPKLHTMIEVNFI